MSIETIDKILERELTERRRGRFFFAGFTVAVLIVLVAMATAM